MLDNYTISVIVFFVALAFVIWFDRKHIEHKYFIFFKRKTTRGEKFIDSVAKISPKFWIILGTIAAIIAIFVIFYGIYQLILTIQLLISKEISGPGVRLLLPYPSSNPVSGFGFIGIPFWFWIIILVIIMFPHEFFHGIIARAEKIKVKSVGVFLLAIFPGAFVDPDEKDFEKSKLRTKLRVVAAGAFANFIVAGIIFGLASYALWPSIVQPGALITSVNQTAPAGLARIPSGAVLQAINGTSINPNYFDYYASYSGLLFFTKSFTPDFVKDFSASPPVLNELSKYQPGDNVTLLVSGKLYTITLAPHPNNPNFPYMGLSLSLNTRYGGDIFSILLPLISLSILISLLVGIVNILPIYPLDGGVFVKSITDKYFPKSSLRIVSFVTGFVIFLILLTVVIPIIV